MASLSLDFLNVERLILRQVSPLRAAPPENIQVATLNYLAMSLENEYLRPGSTKRAGSEG